ncbi:MAG: tripartite tricarboxylate transporter substrate binding protein [Neomegalonema sp.]|nr:tripartite tricarboxylate transporter substrate binding protein [Neomegalonema sp.]
MTNISRRGLLGGAAALGAASALPGVAFGADYPSRPVQVIVPWGAGGGTDATGRIIASILEKQLGQPFNVVNRTGGSGVVGHSAIANAKPDGYTIGLITVEITMMHYAGLTDLTPANYTPLGMVNADSPGVTVSAKAPYKNIKDLADAIKSSKPGALKASGTGQGGIWHLALIGWLRAMGLEANHVTWVPSEGAAPAMQDLVAGGVDIVTASLPEARAMTDAGRAVSLATMGSAREGLFPDLPTLKESIGVEYSLETWRGLAGPKGMPTDVAATLEEAVAAVYNSSDYQEFMKGRGFGLRYMDASAYGTFMERADKSMGETMKAAGLAR